MKNGQNGRSSPKTCPRAKLPILPHESPICSFTLPDICSCAHSSVHCFVHGLWWHVNEVYIILLCAVSSAVGSPRQSLNNNNNSNSAFRPVRHQGDTSAVQSHSFDDRSSWKSVETPSDPKRYVRGSNSKPSRRSVETPSGPKRYVHGSNSKPCRKSVETPSGPKRYVRGSNSKPSWRSVETPSGPKRYVNRH